MDLDLTYHGREIPEAYEVLLLDALKGDEARSVRGDELDASWKIWTPLLHYLDDESAGVRPREYAYGEYIPRTRLHHSHSTSTRTLAAVFALSVHICRLIDSTQAPTVPKAWKSS